MIKLAFGRKSPPVTLDFAALKRKLGLLDKKFTKDKFAHSHVMHKFGRISLRAGGFSYGPGRSYYSDETKIVTIQAAPPQFSDQPEADDDTVRISSCIAFSEQERPFNKKGFGLIIQKDSQNLEDLENALVFGLYGIYDKHGQISIKTLLVPSLDGTNCCTPSKDVPITPENVERALYFAQLCIKQITEGDRFIPQDCLRKAIDADKQAIPSQFIPPDPK